MRQIFVFTASMPIARAHLQDSILKPVSFERMRKHLGDEQTDYLQDLHPGQDGFYAWGAVPGEQNIPNWNKLQVGDLVLTYYDKAYHFFSTVTAKLHSKSLAKEIWKEDKKGNTWEYMYLLSPPQPVSVDIDDPVASRYLRDVYRGFCRIVDADVRRIVEAYAGGLDEFIQKVFAASVPKQLVDNELAQFRAEAGVGNEFDPKNLADGRKKILREVVRRQGQPKFRKLLIEAYAGKCAVTGCSVESVLEAAHISPYLGEESNKVTNGLLLRADIHTLFDLGKLKIIPDGTIQLHEDLSKSDYAVYDGKKIKKPAKADNAPSSKALQMKLDILAQPGKALSFAERTNTTVPAQYSAAL